MQSVTLKPFILSILFSLIFSSGIIFHAHTQEPDYTWWNELHGWDGYSPWTGYMIIKPAYLGPNALPVPETGQGRIDENAGFLVRADWHASAGDNTQNLFLKLAVPFASGRVGLELFWTPVEHYRTSIAIRDRRVSREVSPRGWSAGDVYFRTLIQLLKDHGRWPDISIGLACKTASGDNLEGARYTNAPGYCFDLTAGRSLSVRLRAFGSLGMYVWQTYDAMYPQNDALFYALGLSYTSGKWTADLTLAGYYGYMGEGDRPAVLRTGLKKEWKKGIFHLDYQAGLHDYTYHTLWFGTEFYINR